MSAGALDCDMEEVSIYPDTDSPVWLLGADGRPSAALRPTVADRSPEGAAQTELAAQMRLPLS